MVLMEEEHPGRYLAVKVDFIRVVKGAIGRTSRADWRRPRQSRVLFNVNVLVMAPAWAQARNHINARPCVMRLWHLVINFQNGRHPFQPAQRLQSRVFDDKEPYLSTMLKSTPRERRIALEGRLRGKRDACWKRRAGSGQKREPGINETET